MNNAKTVVITGATRGIGRAIAVLFAQNKYNVVCIYRSDKNAADSLISELNGYGVDSSAFLCDVSNYDETEKTFCLIYEKYGFVDVLINNAGITRDKSFIFMGKDEFDEVLDVNLKGVFNCTKQVMAKMYRKKYGRIINISSIAGIYGNIGQVNYACSKGALISFTKSLVKEYAGYGITINCISPGFIDTDMTRMLSEEQRAHYIGEIPAKRAGEPKEIANLALFLASDKAAYINGENICVSGGLVI